MGRTINRKFMTDNELYEKCLIVGRNARRWKNEFVSLLPEVARRGLHKKHGFATIVEFAAKVGGVGRGTVEKIFQIEKYVADKPALQALIPKVGLAKVRTVATIATRENQAELAKKVLSMSKEALELFAHEQRAPEISRPGAERITVSFSLDRATEFKLRKFRNKMGGAVEWNDVIKKLLNVAEYATNKVGPALKKVRKVRTVSVPANASIVNATTNAPAKITRHVPASVRRELPEQCQYPGCRKPAEVIHHPHRFALRANHENLKPLCKGHHELVHSGYAGLEPKSWLPKTAGTIERKIMRMRCRSG